MTAPSQRRRDPQPISRGWELAAATAGGALIAVALAALTGLSVASALFGGGWVWPHGTGTITEVLGGLLHGHPGHGLPADQLRRVPGPVAVYACAAASELILVAVAALVGALTARYRRPGDARGGMATRREAQHALGLGQLRAARSIIRPDRYGPTADHPPLTGEGNLAPSTGCVPACGPCTGSRKPGRRAGPRVTVNTSTGVQPLDHENRGTTR